MKVLLDQELPHSTVRHLQKGGIESAHVRDLGLSGASIWRLWISAAREIGSWSPSTQTCPLALSDASGPSVIRIRIEGLRAEALADLLSSVMEVCSEDLRQGAMISVTETSIRIRRLPLLA